ncbi:targeting protein for Xklp2 homolog [Thrips palmi]|uniref:Targeting protein for Xklp2 homolog n=1 Tax=Thrips palmi TaxID=161013 RepID=A0A6P9AEP5_THRPL|nr:targeting protein for Xklp2 homolog [Thrips palmi]
MIVACRDVTLTQSAETVACCYTFGGKERKVRVSVVDESRRLFTALLTKAFLHSIGAAMDYDFEAPTYVNFAEAMDEDESEVSRYFDVEHEESFSRLKGTPGVVLPGGLRASAKKASVGSASSDMNDSKRRTSQQGTTSAKPSSRTTTPAKRRSSLRQRTSTVKTPSKLKTPASVKRLGRGKVSTTTPGKVVAALTALKLTPAHKVAVTPGSAKRKQNTDDQQSSPSKRAKLTPKTNTVAATSMEVSPPALNVNGLLQQAIKTLNDSTRKGKRNVTGQLVSLVDGIEVPCLPDKEHNMETRADKAARDPPIQLRSRSIVKTLTEKEGAARPRPRPQSSDRLVLPCKDFKSRSKSIDRLVHKPIKAAEPFISLAEATSRFQNKTPLRFRVKRRDSPANKVKGPILALRATIPQSPALRVKHRNRPVTALSREEQEAIELEELRKNKIKPVPLPDKILKSVQSVPRFEKKPATLPEPFNITEVKKREPSPAPEPARFMARPMPKKIFEGPVGLAEKKQFPLTEPKSPSFCANALKRAKEATSRVTPLKHMNKITMKVLEETGGVQILREKPLGHLGVPYTAQTVKTTTEVKPFSFEERDKERIQRKEEKLKELQKQLSAKPSFHANPLPSFKTPPRIQRTASPAPRSRTPVVLKRDSLQKSAATIPDSKPALISNFKARAPTVLHRKPFEPVKPKRQLPLPDVTLASEIRAKDREVYDRQLMQREQEMEAARQQLKAEKEKREMEEIALLRKQVVHKPNPAPKVKPFEPQPSNKPLTDPNTPFCLKRSRKVNAV